MSLTDLRRTRAITQAALAGALQTDQGSVSRAEKRTDLYVSTLRNFVRALGGDLELVARFPDGAVRIRLAEAGARRQPLVDLLAECDPGALPPAEDCEWTGRRSVGGRLI